MNDAFDKLTDLLDSAYGAPGVVLVLAWCIGLGYFLKMAHWVKNERIPIYIVFWGVIWNVVLRPLPKVPADASNFEAIWFVVQHVSRLIAVGFLIGLVATLLYDKVLKPLEQKFPWLGGLLSTNGDAKPPDPKPPGP